VAALHADSVGALRLSAVVADRSDGPERLVELRRLLEDHVSAGSALGAQVLALDDLTSAFWIVEPMAPVVEAAVGRDETAVQIGPAAVVSIAASRAAVDPSQPVV
jgi:hypothetical protein